jgi:hypothetical protein
VVGPVVGGAVGGGVNTLLSPEKTTHSVGDFLGDDRHLDQNGTRGVFGPVLGVCWLVVVVVVCLLRIAQWMRASIVCDRL